jgi:hypothetical protein
MRELCVIDAATVLRHRLRFGTSTSPSHEGVAT